jgi:hypothetical protein
VEKLTNEPSGQPEPGNQETGHMEEEQVEYQVKDHK